MGNAYSHIPNVAGGEITTVAATYASVTVKAFNPGRPLRSVSTMVKSTTAPALAAGRTISYDYKQSTGEITFYLWKPTASGDVTLIAATAATTFSWFALAD